MKPERGVNNAVVAAQNALDSICGTDLNPFAIAITRFRLLVAAIQACKIKRLHQQSYAWKLNLATGDSLLWGSKPGFNNERTAISHRKNPFDVDPVFAVRRSCCTPTNAVGQGYPRHVVKQPRTLHCKDQELRMKPIANTIVLVIGNTHSVYHFTLSVSGNLQFGREHTK